MSEAEFSASLGQRGSILVLVLLLLSVVVAIAVYGLRTAQVEKGGARIVEKRLQCRPLSESGVRMASHVLQKDLLRDREESRVDHPGEEWGRFPENRELRLPELESGELEGKIVDEQGKLPLNSLLNDEKEWRPAYKRVFFNLLTGYFDLSESRADTVLSSLKDWMDSDEEPSGTRGAESAYYSQRERPWSCRNADLRSVAELRYIRGVSEELYSGGEEKPGLKDLTTVYGNGEININTASQPVLAALVKRRETGLTWAEAKSFAQDMIRYREDRMHWDRLKDEQWWSDVAGSLSIQLHPVTGTASSVFSVNIVSQAGSVTCRSHAVLKRESGSSEQDNSPGVKRLFYELQ